MDGGMIKRKMAKTFYKIVRERNSRDRNETSEEEVIDSERKSENFEKFNRNITSKEIEGASDRMRNK